MKFLLLSPPSSFPLSRNKKPRMKNFARDVLFFFKFFLFFLTILRPLCLENIPPRPVLEIPNRVELISRTERGEKRISKKETFQGALDFPRSFLSFSTFNFIFVFIVVARVHPAHFFLWLVFYDRSELFVGSFKNVCGVIFCSIDLEGRKASSLTPVN